MSSIHEQLRNVDNQLAEFFDGYVLLGFVAGTNQPLVIYSNHDQKTLMALNVLLEQAKRPVEQTSSNEQ